jgi:hydrogenase maturation protease
MTDFWQEQARPGPETVVVADQTIGRGSLVRLRPRAGGDVFDLALADRLAAVDSIEEDSDGKLHVTVTLEDDPGRDLGAMRALGHRFFFGVDEIEPVEASLQPLQSPERVLVAGIGNIFLGDDGFGVAVANRLRDRPLPDGVDVRDFGIRGMDLAYALQEDYVAAILVDAAPRGEAPGTVSVIEPELDQHEVTLDTHGLDPVRVLSLARALGRVPARVLVVACEPQRIVRGDHDDDLVGELSDLVQEAVPTAADLVESLVRELASAGNAERKAVMR